MLIVPTPPVPKRIGLLRCGGLNERNLNFRKRSLIIFVTADPFPAFTFLCGDDAVTQSKQKNNKLMKTLSLLLAFSLLLTVQPAHAKPGRTTTIQGSDGRGATRTVNVQGNNGSATRSINTTTFRGQNVSRLGTISKTETGRTAGYTVTGPAGQTATSTRNVTRQDGTRTAEVSVSGPKGNSKAFTTTRTATK